MSNLFETLEIIGDRVTGIYYLYFTVADTYAYFAPIIFGMREQSAFLLIFGFSHGVYEVGDFGGLTSKGATTNSRETGETFDSYCRNFM